MTKQNQTSSNKAQLKNDINKQIIKCAVFFRPDFIEKHGTGTT